MKNLQYIALAIKKVCFFKKKVYNADNGGGWEEFEKNNRKPHGQILFFAAGFVF